MLHGIEKVRDFIRTGIASATFSENTHRSLCRLLNLNRSFDKLRQLINAYSMDDKNWKPGVEKMGGKLLKSNVFKVKPKSAYFIMAHKLLGVMWPDPYLGEQMKKEKYNSGTLYEKLTWGSYIHMARNMRYILFQ
tara:strand:- start:14 stop:418 length:405 start_codon:yes stop_codon:yes gene_type:complete